VREAVFAMLGPLDGERVLDLFAGSGALGIEALSRGAGAAAFVDSAAGAVAAVRRNLQTLSLDGEVAQMAAAAYLRQASAGRRLYDLVFLDPPYAYASKIASELFVPLRAVLAPAARVVVESARRSPVGLDLPLLRERAYGDTLIRIHESR
jgi:16S rRNA (guanine966-N2)-methyltransferase